MSAILDEGLNLICKYILIFNHNPIQDIIDYKQFSRELRKVYRMSNYISFSTDKLDETLELIEYNFIQKRNTWVADFVRTLTKLYCQSE